MFWRSVLPNNAASEEQSISILLVDLIDLLIANWIVNSEKQPAAEHWNEKCWTDSRGQSKVNWNRPARQDLSNSFDHISMEAAQI